VVDDDSVFRDELATLLGDWGHRAEPVSSAPKALELLESEEVDAIFSDIRMPRMNGVDFLRQVRARWPHVYVVMVTGYATVETAVEAMKLGAFDYLRKPFRSEDVQRILRLVDEQRAFSAAEMVANDPTKLAEQWAKERHDVLLVGGPAQSPGAGITVADLGVTDSSQGIKGTVFSFVESHRRPAVILTGVERMFESHRTEELADVLGTIVQELQGKAQVAVGFDPTKLSDAAVAALRTAISSARVHGALTALANPLRRHILRRLSEGATSFTEVMRAAGIEDSPKLSFHLRTLQDEGLIVHSNEAYQLTDMGREAVRVLAEADRLGASDSARAFLFSTVPKPKAPARRGQPRSRSRR